MAASDAQAQPAEKKQKHKHKLVFDEHGYAVGESGQLIQRVDREPAKEGTMHVSYFGGKGFPTLRQERACSGDEEHKCRNKTNDLCAWCMRPVCSGHSSTIKYNCLDYTTKATTTCYRPECFKSAESETPIPVVSFIPDPEYVKAESKAVEKSKSESAVKASEVVPVSSSSSSSASADHNKEVESKGELYVYTLIVPQCLCLVRLASSAKEALDEFEKHPRVARALAGLRELMIFSNPDKPETRTNHQLLSTMLTRHAHGQTIALAATDLNLL